MYLIYASIGVGVLALLIVVCLALRIVRVNVDNKDMNRVSGYIKKATNAFIMRHYRTIIMFMVVPLIPLIFFNMYIALSFIAGALLSLLSAYISLRIAVEANVRTAYISTISPFRAFNGGAVVGDTVGDPLKDVAGPP
ncbi:MAG: sodium/proton-translocating pyrophosphatase [archaeon YNP-WB-040]|nr:sodium/proton-translocating pyrophosphatase [Candidatus Culexarchaeum yellowstonense]